MCKRPGCKNSLKTGRDYCSTKCSAMDRERVREEKLGSAMSESDTILRNLVSTLKLDDDEFNPEEIPIPTYVVTYGDHHLSYDGREDYRPGELLSFEIIDKILDAGAPLYALEMKRARILSVFIEGRFSVESPDRELAQVGEAAFRRIMAQFASDFTHSAFAYGSYFGEKSYRTMSKYELGLSDSKSGTTRFWVPNCPAPVHPKTIKHILRTPGGSFNGYVQAAQGPYLSGNRYGFGAGDDITVPVRSALVIPYNAYFRQLWGKTFLTTIYPLWMTYERVLRAMIRYMDRMAVPVVVAKAPGLGSTEVPGTGKKVRNLRYALALAASLAKSNAVAIPSNMDENGNPLWSLEYLTADERAQSFIEVLEYLTQEIIRASLSAERSLTQSSGGVGSYNIGEVHAEASASTAEMIMVRFLYYINTYFLPDISLYNRGINGPPIYIRTQPIVNREHQTLINLVNIAAQTQAGQTFFGMVDFEALAKRSSIPVLPEEDRLQVIDPNLLKKKEVDAKIRIEEEKIKVAKEKPEPNVAPPGKSPEEKALEGGFLVLNPGNNEERYALERIVPYAG